MEEFHMQKKHLKTFDLCMIGVITAVIVIMAQISIPMPLGVPMTMQTFAITLAGIVLGSKKGAITSLIYILLGAIGVPVFANFNGGYQLLVGPTGGFIISFPIMAYIIGLGIEYKNRFKGCFTICLILGTCINYLFGVIMFCFLMHSTPWVAFTACVLPFIPTAVIKAVLASILGLSLRKRIQGLS